jgi:hypothetical protein
MSKNRPKRPLPPANRIPEAIPAGTLNITSYKIGSWCPTPDGSGPATAVAIRFETAIPDVAFAVRLKSPAAVDEMIEALLRHKNDVWPEGTPHV